MKKDAKAIHWRDAQGRCLHPVNYLVFSGEGSIRHCVFCLESFASLEEAATKRPGYQYELFGGLDA